jgi:hypothetical protein
MPNIYEYVRHPRAEELRLAGPTKTRDLRRLDHPNPFVRFNARFGLRITLVVGTMWAAYIFTVLALFALPDAIKQGTYFIIVWLSSSFLQLVLLPIIIVGQNIQARAADKRSEDTYKDAESDGLRVHPARGEGLAYGDGTSPPRHGSMARDRRAP